MAGITIYVSILILNVNGLRSWIKKQELTISLQEMHLTDLNRHCIERVEKDLPSKWALKAGRSSYTHI
jgi:hypothetical protein